MTDPSTIKRGSKWVWRGQKVVCTQTDEWSGCGPVFSDPETGNDVLRVSRDEFGQFDRYFVAESSSPMEVQEAVELERVRAAELVDLLEDANHTSQVNSLLNELLEYLRVSMETQAIRQQGDDLIEKARALGLWPHKCGDGSPCSSECHGVIRCREMCGDICVGDCVM